MTTEYQYVGKLSDEGLIEALAILFSRLHCHSAPHAANVLRWGERALSSYPALCSRLDEFVGAALALGLPLAPDALRGVARQVRASDRAVWLFRTLMRARALDGYLAPVEGNRQLDWPALLPEEAFSWQSFTQGLIRAIETAPRRRYTPFGVHTDDTQYLVSGIIAGLGPAEEASNLPGAWRGLDRHSAWRNIGRRTRAFLQGDERGFVGPPTLGDLLRAVALFLESELRGADWRPTAALLFSQPQTEAVGLFIAALDARSRPEPRPVELALAALARHYDRHAPAAAGRSRPPGALINHISATLVRASEPAQFLAGLPELGSDYDTYGFLGGLFADEDALPSAALLARPCEASTFVTGHVLAAALRVAGVAHELPPGYREYYLEAERALNLEIQRLRAGQGD